MCDSTRGEQASTWKRVIFLDVDGVLHSESAATSLAGMFEAVPLRLLRDIVSTSGAVVVLSSAWRQSEAGIDEVNGRLEQAGIAAVVSCTPTHGFATRSDEILHWLSLHPTVEACVALDDMDLTEPHGAPLAAMFVHVDPARALTQADADAAVAALRRPLNRSALPAAQTRDERLW